MSKLNESLSAAPGSIGFPILQDHQYASRGLSLHQRSGLYAVGITDRLDSEGELGHYVEDTETRGDMSGFLYWDRNGSAREIGSWREVFGAIRVIDPSSSDGGPTTGGGETIPTPGTSPTTPSSRPRGEIPPNSRPPQGIRVGGNKSPDSTEAAQFPAKGETFGSPPPTTGGGTTGGGSGDKSMRPEPPVGGQTSSPVLNVIQPIRDQEWFPDGRYVPKTANKPAGAGGSGSPWPDFPCGHIGLLVQATNEDQQIEEFHPTDPRLVAPNRNGATSYGTVVCDLTASGSYSDERRARLQTVFRVARVPSGELSFQGNTQNTIAINIGRTGNNDLVGGLFCDKGGRSTQFGAMSVRDGGHLDLPGDCKHRFAQTADGEPIAPAHLSTLAFWRNRAQTDASSTPQHDGPLEFEEDYPVPPDLLYPVKVHLGWNPLLRYFWQRDGGTKFDQGGWSWWTTAVMGSGGGDTGDPPPPDDPPPPTTPGGDGDPPPPVTTPGGGGGGPPVTPGGSGGGSPPGQSTPGGDGRGTSTVAGYVTEKHRESGLSVTPLWPTKLHRGNSQDMAARDSAYTHLDTSFPAISFRPQLIEPGRTDLTSSTSGDPEAVKEYLDESPVIVRLLALGQQTQGPEGGNVFSVSAGNHEGSDGPFNYTQRPGSSRSKGGTAPGILAFVPPETDATDVDDDFAPDNVAVSESYVTFAPGVRMAVGTPDVRSGRIRSGMSLKGNGGSVEVYTHDSQGDETLVATITSAGIELADGKNLQFGTTTGTQIGTTSTQKIGFFGATPTVRSSGWSVTGGSTDKTLDAGSPTTQGNADVLGTLMTELLAKGIIEA